MLAEITEDIQHDYANLTIIALYTSIYFCIICAIFKLTMIDYSTVLISVSVS